MSDPLLEEDPWVKEKLTERELKTFKNVLLKIVSLRFPSLIELAEAKLAHAEQPEALNILVVQISAVANEQVARQLLESFSAS